MSYPTGNTNFEASDLTTAGLLPFDGPEMSIQEYMSTLDNEQLDEYLLGQLVEYNGTSEETASLNGILSSPSPSPSPPHSPFSFGRTFHLDTTDTTEVLDHSAPSGEALLTQIDGEEEEQQGTDDLNDVSRRENILQRVATPPQMSSPTSLSVNSVDKLPTAVAELANEHFAFRDGQPSDDSIRAFPESKREGNNKTIDYSAASLDGNPPALPFSPRTLPFPRRTLHLDITYRT